MYKDFFGFTKEPFNITPDPDLFYCSKIHEEVLEVLEYQLKKKRGFIVLTGEVGTGKTLICKTLITKLYNFHVSYIINPFLSPHELLIQICKDFNINFETKDEIGILFEKIKEFLLLSNKEGRNAVVIVDEAQNLSFESFEMLRQLSNIELDNEKLIQIILAGQQELIEKLNSKELRQLNQRISTILELKPLNKEETKNYINFRVEQSLKYKKYLFTNQGIKKIYEYSKGFPREINQIAEIALLVAFSKQNKKVTKSDVIDAAKEYYNKRKKIKKYKNSKKKIILLGILIIIAIFITAYNLNLYIFNFLQNSILTKSQKKSNIIKKKQIIDNAAKGRDNDTIVLKKDNQTPQVSSSLQKDNKSLSKKKKIYYAVFYNSINKKDLKMIIHKLKKNKIEYFIYKNKPENNYIIHFGFLKNIKNAIKLKNKLEKIGINSIKIKKIEK